jgi:hypothetical protein
MKLLFGLMMVSLMFSGESGVEKKIRQDFHDGEFTEKRLEVIIDNNGYENTALTKAYKGLCETMMAEYVYLPTTKLKYFNKGKKKIDESIRQQPDNPELRYIRLMVQMNAPSMLGYYREIQKDLDFFLSNKQNFKGDKSWLKIFSRNLLYAKYIKDKQRTQLKRFQEDVQ